MVDQHTPLRATGLTRALGVLLLLAGIVAMHAAVFAAAPAARAHTAPVHIAPAPTAPAQAATTHQAHDDTTYDHAPMTAHHSTMAMPAVDSYIEAGSDCAGDDCGGGHVGMHACVFILTAVALALMIVLLYSLPLDRPDGDSPKLRRGPRTRNRAPPWTVLSLAELSILRI